MRFPNFVWGLEQGVSDTASCIPKNFWPKKAGQLSGRKSWVLRFEVKPYFSHGNRAIEIKDASRQHKKTLLRIRVLETFWICNGWSSTKKNPRTFYPRSMFLSNKWFRSKHDLIRDYLGDFFVATPRDFLSIYLSIYLSIFLPFFLSFQISKYLISCFYIVLYLVNRHTSGPFVKVYI